MRSVRPWIEDFRSQSKNIFINKIRRYWIAKSLSLNPLCQTGIICEDGGVRRRTNATRAISPPDWNRPPLRGGLFIFDDTLCHHFSELWTRAQGSGVSGYIQKLPRL